MAGWTPLVFIILASTCIFALCWGFMIVIWRQEYVILPDSVVDLIARYPTELTLISSVISTILSAASTILLSLAVKQATNHYITRPLSLVELHTAIAITKHEPLVRWDYYKLSIFTLVFFSLVTLLNSSWTTFILPTSLLWPVSIEGYSLDLSSSVFNTKLASDTAQFGYYQNGYDILDIMASMSGTSATRLAVTGGNDSVFAFNGVSYSTSSGGILPAVEDYAGSTLPPGEYIGLEYYGGQVAVNISLVNDRGRSGLARSYTVTQQGLSANINCSYLADLDQSEFSMTVNNNNVSLPEGYITTWSWTAYCPHNGSGYNFWVTVDFWLDNNEYDGFLGIVPCPAGNFTNPEVTSFDIFVRSYGEYGYLNPTVCHVAPYVALFNVTYNQSMISVDQHPHGPIQLLQNSSFVTAFISNVVYQLSISSQTAYNNPLGDLLRLKDSNSSLTDVLQNYFRGVVEFSATYLRSAYSAGNASTSAMMQDLYTDKNAFTPLNGTMYITTYGWYRGRLTYIYILCVFTVIWAVTVSAAVYSLIQECIRPRTNPAFDASNPVHLMMASGLKTLPGFEDNGDLENERARVRLLDGQDVAPDNAVGEKTSARPTRSTMPRFEIVPQVSSL